MLKEKGFTLIELVMIIVILGILAAVALPKYFDLQSQAKIAAEEGVVGGVRSGVATYYANECAAGSCGYPGTLDSASSAECSSSNRCFGNVLSQAIDIDEWEKTGTMTYQGPTDSTYTYSNSTGVFQ